MKSSRKQIHMRTRRTNRFDKLWYVAPSEKSKIDISAYAWARTVTDTHDVQSDEEGLFMKMLPKSFFSIRLLSLGGHNDNDGANKDKRVSRLARKSSILFFCCLLVIYSMENVAFSADERMLSSSHTSNTPGDELYMIKYDHPHASTDSLSDNLLGTRSSTTEYLEGQDTTTTSTDTKMEIGKTQSPIPNNESSSNSPVELRKLRMNHDQHEHHHPYQLSSVVSRPSGLRPSPGSPVSNQKIRLDDITKKYQPSSKLISRIRTQPHKIADLDCTLYGGPFEKMNLYWKDIEDDTSYLPPFCNEIGTSMKMIAASDAKETEQSTSAQNSRATKYLTFEPMLGGLDHNRMVFELYLVLASAMGRTLVLPPKQKYLYMVSCCI